jgi:hypothetical protein
MATQIYKVRDPSGAIREIEGPAGATDEQVISKAKELFATPTAPVAPTGGVPVGRQGVTGITQQPLTGVSGVIKSIGAPFLQALSEGVIKGGGNVMFGGQQFVGKGLSALGATETGQSLIEDAARRQAETQARVAPFKQEYPVSTGIGEYGTEAAITAPVGGIIAKPLAAAARYAPAIAPYVSPVVNALRSSGFSSGLVTKGAPLATRAADIGARIVGGGVTGFATAALTNPDEISTGAGVGAGLAVAAPPLVKITAKSLGFLKDAFTGRLGEVGAGRIARDVAGDRIGAIRAALLASPADVTAAQATSGIQKDAWQALGAMTSKTDDISSLLKRQAADDLAQLQRMAEGGNATEMRTAYDQSIKRLNQLTADMRNVELQAANQAAQTTNRLAPQMQQRDASMVNALREGMPANLPSGAAGTPAPGISGINAATEAAQQAAIAAKGKPGFLTAGTRSQEWQETSDAFAEIAKQRRAEAGFIERQIGSLEDYGLRPLDAGSITAAIDTKLSTPGLRASSNMTKVLQAVKEDIANLTAKGGGVIDAHDLYTLRKEGINERIMQILGQTDPKVSAKVTRGVLQEVRPLIDDAIEKAGGTGWRDYLKTYSQGMQSIDQKAMAAEAAKLFKDSPQEYVRLVRGNNPDAVEAIFGPGSYDIFKEMGSKMPTLEKLASNVERTASMKEAAAAGTEKLGDVIGADSFRFRIPFVLSKGATAANVTLDMLEKRLDKKIFSELQKGMASGKSALEMLDTLPASDRSEVLRVLADPSSWGKTGAVAARAVTRQEQPNKLAPSSTNVNALTGQ